jgi:hypothetical protein
VAEPPREIEVEVLPPGALPTVRSASPQDHAGAKAGPQFEDPFVALVSRLMDSAFSIPGTNIRFGLDPIIGLIWGVGDGATALTSLMLLVQSARHGLPKIVLARMALNIVLNTTLGALPLLGDAFSFWFKSNDRNYELLRKYAAEPGSSTRTDWIFVIGLLGGLAVILALTVIGYASLLMAVFRLLFGGNSPG